MEQEVWKIHPIYTNYEVSTLGNIRHITNKKNLKPHLAGAGYPKILIRFNGRYTNLYVHSMVLETFIGPKPDGEECNHKDGIKTNNTISNLEWTTRSKNLKHSYDTGLHKYPNLHGERNPNAKITLKDIKIIREMLAKGVVQSEIVKMFGISQTQVSRIKLNNTWKRILPR